MIIFTSSLESTHRLYGLLRLYYIADGMKVAEYSSNLSQHIRKRVMKEFRSGDIECLVCSDVAARGLDIAHVTSVINYDVPIYTKTYIHRVGRTARAGNIGTAYTLVKKHEIQNFKRVTHGAHGSNLCEYTVDNHRIQECTKRFIGSLTVLKQLLLDKRNVNGDMNMNMDVKKYGDMIENEIARNEDIGDSSRLNEEMIEVVAG